MVTETMTGRPRVDLEPATTYEVVTRQMVDELNRQLAEIKRRIDGLFWLVGGAVVVELVTRLMGGG